MTPRASRLRPKASYEIVVIGASKGGLQALKTVLSSLSSDFTLPVIVIQHRDKKADESLNELLQKVSALPVEDVEDKYPIRPGRVYVAPADYHLLVEKGSFALSLDEPVQHARPSIDVGFESAAEVYGRGVIGVILTGANEDGAKGLAAIKRQGGLAIVQEPKTAESPRMPEAAIAATEVDKILPLEEIGPFLVGVVKRGGG